MHLPARVLVLVPDLRGVGGAEHLNRRVVALLEETAQELAVVERTLVRGSFSKVRYVLRVLITAARGWDLVFATHPRLGALAVAAAKLGRARSVVQTLGRESWGPTSKSFARSLRLATRVFALTSIGADIVARQHRVERTRICVVPPPIDTATRGSPTPRAHALTVTRLVRSDRYKGIDRLIEAWPRVRTRVAGAQLLVVGDGDDRTRLEELASERGLDEAVRFLGKVSDEELDLLYRSAVVFVLPSSFSVARKEGEGFGIVYAEAALRGTPSVALRTGVTPDVVENEVTGILVPPDDPEALATAIATLLADPARAELLGTAAEARARAEHAHDRWARSVLHCLGEALEA